MIAGYLVYDGFLLGVGMIVLYEIYLIVFLLGVYLMIAFNYVSMYICAVIHVVVFDCWK